MKVYPTPIEDLLVLKPKTFADARGSFCEVFNSKVFNEAVSGSWNFVQDNQSISQKNVLRGLHAQLGNPQAKLVRVSDGCVLDVAVDLRKDSKSFGKYFSIVLSSHNNKQLFIPEGFAHGFFTLSDSATLNYKVSDYYNPKTELCIRWNDPDLNIEWKTKTYPIISSKDSLGISFRDYMKI